jgi:hypothetical protein
MNTRPREESRGSRPSTAAQEETDSPLEEVDSNLRFPNRSLPSETARPVSITVRSPDGDVVQIHRPQRKKSGEPQTMQAQDGEGAGQVASTTLAARQWGQFSGPAWRSAGSKSLRPRRGSSDRQTRSTSRHAQAGRRIEPLGFGELRASALSLAFGRISGRQVGVNKGRRALSLLAFA